MRMGEFVNINEPIIDTLLLNNIHHDSMSLVLTNVPFLLQDPFKTQYIYSSYLLRLLLDVTISQTLFVLFMTLTVFVSTVQVFWRMPLYWYLIFFL